MTALSIHITLIILGAILLCPLGHGIVRYLAPQSNLGWLGWMTAFLCGQSVFTLGLFLVDLMGLKLTLPIQLVFLLIATLVMGSTLQKSRIALVSSPIKTPRMARKNQGGEVVLGVIGVLCLLFISLSMWGASLSEGMIDIPGLCIWGLKAKVFFIEQTIPSSFFHDASRQWAHLNYPLDYPLLLTWFYSFMGTVDDYAVKIVPPALATLMILSIYLISKRLSGLSLLAIWLAVLITSSPSFLDISTQFYAETILDLQILLGMYFIILGNKKTLRHSTVHLGWFLLASAAWTKNEGLLFACCALLAWCLTYQAKYSASGRYFSDQLTGLQILIPLALFVVPWRCFCWHHSLPAQDYVFNREMWHTPERLIYPILALFSFGKYLFFDSLNLTIISCGAILVVFLNKQEPALHFLGSTLIFYVASLSLSFVFTSHQLDWHLTALPRLANPLALGEMIMILIGAPSFIMGNGRFHLPKSVDDENLV